MFQVRGRSRRSANSVSWRCSFLVSPPDRTCQVAISRASVCRHLHASGSVGQQIATMVVNLQSDSLWFAARPLGLRLRHFTKMQRAAHCYSHCVTIDL
jgi:hypothetical protein